MTSDQRRTANRHPELAAELRRVIGKYAMRSEVTGGVLLCQPRDVELQFHPAPGYPQWRGHNGKVCFGSATTAGLAAAEIAELDGADKVMFYPCPRGGHFHHVSQNRRQRTVADIMARIAAAAHRGGR